MTATLPTVPLLIQGEFVESTTSQWRDVVNPATQEVLARVPFATPAEIDAAIASAKTAFKTWRKTPIGARAHFSQAATADPRKHGRPGRHADRRARQNPG